MTSTPHHGEIDTSPPTLHPHGQDIHVAIRHVVDRLLVKHVGQGRHLVAQFSCLLKLQTFGVRHHACLQRTHHLLGITAQETFGIGYILSVVQRVDVPHAGS